jgi:hypothetical protein
VLFDFYSACLRLSPNATEAHMLVPVTFISRGHLRSNLIGRGQNFRKCCKFRLVAGPIAGTIQGHHGSSLAFRILDNGLPWDFQPENSVSTKWTGSDYSLRVCGSPFARDCVLSTTGATSATVTNRPPQCKFSSIASAGFNQFF